MLGVRVVTELFCSSVHLMMGGVEWQPFTLGGSHLGFFDGAQFCYHTMRCCNGKSTSGFETG